MQGNSDQIQVKGPLAPFKVQFLLVSVYFTLFCLLSSSIPFFWDSVYYSTFAHTISEPNRFFHALPPSFCDNGGFPLYAYWMATAWLLFGKTLLVSHLAQIPLLCGIAYGFLKLAGRLLHPRLIPFALLLLCIEPCFMTQSMLMGYDILLLCLFLLSLNALLGNNQPAFYLFLALLAFCNNRGIVSACMVGLIQGFLVLRNKNGQFQQLIPYLLVFSGLLAWGIYHKKVSGWYFISPEREKTDEHILGLRLAGKQLLLVAWKLIDSGRIVLWLLFAGSCWQRFQKRRYTPAFLMLGGLFFISLISLLLLTTSFSNPSGARYFLVPFVFLILGVCLYMEQFSRKTQVKLGLLICIALLSGNAWIYPERYSNDWDSSMKVLPFFQLKKELIQFVQEKKIDPSDIATQFPLTDPLALTDLSSAHIQFMNALDGPISKFRYYLHSNVCNTDLLPQIEQIKNKWVVLKELNCGQVYIRLYENPDFLSPTTR